MKTMFKQMVAWVLLFGVSACLAAEVSAQGRPLADYFRQPTVYFPPSGFPIGPHSRPIDHAPPGHPALVSAADGSGRVRLAITGLSIPRPDLTVLGFVYPLEDVDDRFNQRLSFIVPTEWLKTTTLPRSPRVGEVVRAQRRFGDDSGQIAEELTFLAPVRRRALDGSEYEAAPMVQRLGGVGWMTYYFAYRMGLVAGHTDYDPSTRSRFPAAWLESAFPSAMFDFELQRLPPPFVEGEVVEYVNLTVSPESTGGHYFYAATAADRDLLDRTPGWERTGRDFKSGGYLPVCRLFYRPPAGGPGSHVYTASADECQQLAGQPGFVDEGIAFRASLPRPVSATLRDDDPARCHEGTIPLYRAFNDPARKGNRFAPNHRYARNVHALRSFAANHGWSFEGIALCVPE